MNRMNKKTVAILASSALIVSLVVIIFLLGNHPVKNNKNEYFDKNSGETISDPEGKSPETANSSDNIPVFLGFKEIINAGLSKYQQEAIMKTFESYSKDHNNTVKEVSLKISSLKTTISNDTDSTKNNITFDVTINRKNNYIAKVEYFDISSVQLFLYSKDNTPVYTSPIIDGYTLPSDHTYSD